MLCPFCGQYRPRAEWSNVQWKTYSPDAVAGDMNPRNCCRGCQVIEGSYYNGTRGIPQSPQRPLPQPQPQVNQAPQSSPPGLQLFTGNSSISRPPPPSPLTPTPRCSSSRSDGPPPPTQSSSSSCAQPTRPPSSSSSTREWPPRQEFFESSLVIPAQWPPLRAHVKIASLGAEKWLQVHVPLQLLSDMKTWFDDVHARHTATMRSINQHWKRSLKTNFQKYMASIGAIRVPDACPNDYVSWINETTGERYLDPMNETYHAVFTTAWPGANFVSNVKQVGDFLEAILAMASLLRKDLGTPLASWAGDNYPGENFGNILNQVVPEWLSLQSSAGGEEFVTILELALLSRWILTTYYWYDA